jgi:hypothetical protein
MSGNAASVFVKFFGRTTLSNVVRFFLEIEPDLFRTMEPGEINSFLIQLRAACMNSSYDWIDTTDVLLYACNNDVIF